MSTHESRRRYAIAQLVAYVLIVTVGAYAFWEAGQNDEDACREAQANRTAIRNVVVAIEDLGRDLVVGGTDDGAPTPEQLATLAQFREFRERELARLVLPVCPD